MLLVSSVGLAFLSIFWFMTACDCKIPKNLYGLVSMDTNLDPAPYFGELQLECSHLSPSFVNTIWGETGKLAPSI